MKPIIGLARYPEQAGTDGRGTITAAFLPEIYVNPIIAAGGMPVLLPPRPAVWQFALLEMWLQRHAVG